jgi:hypothetical protein
MCRLTSIQMMTMVVYYVKLFISLYVFIVGVGFVTDVNLHQAFDNEYQVYGGALIFLAILSAISVFPHRWATDRHNRAIIFMVFCFDTIVFGAQIHVGRTVTSYVLPDFPKEMQLDCLMKQPVLYSKAACAAYIESDRVSGMRLMWSYYFTDRLTKSSFQMLTQIEGDICCGFFAPMSCDPNLAPFPANKGVEGVDSEYIRQRVECGPIVNYYPVTDQCLAYHDLSAVPPIVGGCNYDLGIGYCLDKEVTDDSLGCASFVEDYMVAQIESTGVLLAGVTFINMLAMLLQCCIWWKRKETDVFPSFEIDRGNKKTEFHNIKDEFEVKPTYEVLAKKKFLPMPRHLKVEMARQALEQAKVDALLAAEEEEYGIEDEKFGGSLEDEEGGEGNDNGNGIAEGEEEDIDAEAKEEGEG